MNEALEAFMPRARGRDVRTARHRTAPLDNHRVERAFFMLIGSFRRHGLQAAMRDDDPSRLLPVSSARSSDPRRPRVGARPSRVAGIPSTASAGRNSRRRCRITVTRDSRLTLRLRGSISDEDQLETPTGSVQCRWGGRRIRVGVRDRGEVLRQLGFSESPRLPPILGVPRRTETLSEPGRWRGHGLGRDDVAPGEAGSASAWTLLLRMQAGHDAGVGAQACGGDRRPPLPPRPSSPPTD